MKILLWKIGALGDVLMTTPLLRQLRRACPTAQIEYLTGRGCAPMLEGNPHVDRVVTFDEQILYHARATDLRKLLPLLRGYDSVYVLDKHWIFSLLAFAARVPLRVGFARRRFEGWPHTVEVPYGVIRHEIDCYLDLGEAAGIVVDREDVALELPARAPYPMEPPYTVLVNSGGANAGERSEVRTMPDAVFDALVRHCLRRAPVVFLGSSGEAPYYQRWTGDGVRNLCGQTSLQQAWSVLRGASEVFTTDTGLMHMAAAVNSNVTAIFGPTHPLRKCPPGARWVWADAAVYDGDYEVLGRVPRRQYFETITLADIVERARPAPWPRGPGGPQP